MREALEGHARHLALERDRAIELRDAADQERMGLQRELTLKNHRTSMMEQDFEKQMYSMNLLMEEALAERDEAIAANECAQAKQEESKQRQKTLQAELDSFISRSSVAEKSCEDLKKRVRHLEWKVRKSEEQQLFLEEELAKEQSETSKRIDMKKQLAESLLSALDISYSDVARSKDTAVQAEACSVPASKFKHAQGTAMGHLRAAQPVESAKACGTYQPGRVWIKDYHRES